MSTCLPPLTMGQRPPFRGGPPIRTTFDGGFSGDFDPDFEIALESAERLLKTVDGTPIDGLPVLLRLLKQRYKWLDDELWVRRSLTGLTLPPIRGFDMDPFLETSDTVEGRFLRMLDWVNDAIVKVQVKMDMQKCPFPLSEL